LPLSGGDDDPLGQAGAEDLVLGFQVLDVPGELPVGRLGDQEEQGLEQRTHVRYAHERRGIMGVTTLLTSAHRPRKVPANSDLRWMTAVWKAVAVRQDGEAGRGEERQAVRPKGTEAERDPGLGISCDRNPAAPPRKKARTRCRC
jgi:hypothetical protein